MLVGIVKCHVMVVVYVDLILFPFLIDGSIQYIFFWFVRLETFLVFFKVFFKFFFVMHVCLFVYICWFN